MGLSETELLFAIVAMLLDEELVFKMHGFRAMLLLALLLPLVLPLIVVDKLRCVLQ